MIKNMLEFMVSSGFLLLVVNTIIVVWLANLIGGRAEIISRNSNLGFYSTSTFLQKLYFLMFLCLWCATLIFSITWVLLFLICGYNFLMIIF